MSEHKHGAHDHGRHDHAARHVHSPDAAAGAAVDPVCGMTVDPSRALTRRLGDRNVEIEAPPLARWKDRTPVVLDDIVSSARTMALALRRIADQGLPPAVCVGVHGVFSGDAMMALREAGAAKIVTTNTIEHPSNAIDVSALVARRVERFRSDSGS